VTLLLAKKLDAFFVHLASLQSQDPRCW